MVLELLQSMLPEKGLIYEVVVVIDSNDDPSYATTIKNKYSDKFKLTVYEQPNSGRAVTRNKCVELSTGDTILFFDDDTVVEMGAIKKHVDFQQLNPGKMLVGNSFRNPALVKTDFDKFIVHTEKPSMEDEPIKEVSVSNYAFTTQNLSVAKDIIVKLGGFDDRLKLAVEDTELSLRAMNSGVKIIRDLSVHAWHNDWPDIKGYIKRNNEYIESHKVLLEHYPELSKTFPGFIHPRSGFFKRTVLKIFRIIISPMVMKENGLFKMLPLNAKFFLYNRTIAAYTSTNQ